MKKLRVYMGITTTSTVIDSQAYVLRDIEELYGDKIEFVYPDLCVRRMFHDYARNMVCEEFLASDCDVLWFLDSDITPNKFIGDLLTIYLDKWQLAGATYPVFMIPPGGDILEILFTCYRKNPETGNLQPSKVPTEGQEFVDGLATGCLFIKREVLEKMKKPYFEFKFDPETRTILEGEDLGFCRKAGELGYKFFTDFSFVCKHQKNVDLLDLNNYAIQYSNRAVLEYDKRIKETVQPALHASYQQGYQQGVEDFKQELKRLSKPQSPIVTPQTNGTLWLPR